MGLKHKSQSVQKSSEEKQNEEQPQHDEEQVAEEELVFDIEEHHSTVPVPTLSNRETMSQPLSVCHEGEEHIGKEFRQSSSDPFSLGSKKKTKKSKMDKVLKEIKENPLIKWKDESDTGIYN